MSLPRRKITLVVGARPNFMKVAALVEAMVSDTRWQPYLVHTGQHYDAELSEVFFDQLKLPRPDVNLGVGSGSHASQTAHIMLRFETVLEEHKPDLVVVVGDVNSTLACSLVAAKLCIPVAHIEAGLRSFDRTMPEEINRMLTDALAEYLFASEPAAVNNLRREGIPEQRVFLVGNVMIDTLKRFLLLARKSRIHEQLRLSVDGKSVPCPYAVLTLHRHSNVDQRERLQGLMDAICQISQQIPMVFPVHPRTRKQLSDFGLDDLLAKKGSRIMPLPPLAYLDFVALMEKATFVMTDSGGIQEETTVLDVPCLTVRENTERPITVSEGTNEIVGTSPEKILLAAAKILRGESKRAQAPALWDGFAARRIVHILEEQYS